MKLSIIVPVYNVEMHLGRCIQSLLNQSIPDYEIILVDDGSTDSSYSIMEEYYSQNPNKIRLLHKANGGQGDARNMGLDNASGEFITFVDSDDYVDPDCYSPLISLAERGGYDIVVFDSIWEFPSYTRLMCSVNGADDSRAITPSEYILSPQGPCNKLIRRNLIDKCSFRFPSGIIFEDLAAIPQLGLYTDKIYYSKTPLYHYVQTDVSTVRRSGFNEKWLDMIPAIQLLDNALKNAFPNEAEYLAWYHFLYETSLKCYKYGRYSDIDRIADIMRSLYPHWEKNPYIKTLAPKNKRIVSWLFYHKRYNIIRLGQKLKRLMRK